MCDPYVQTALGRWILGDGRTGDGSPENLQPASADEAHTGEGNGDTNETSDALEEEADLLMTLAREPEADASTRLHMYKQVRLATYCLVRSQ